MIFRSRFSGLIAAITMLSASGLAFLILSGAGYWALRRASADEAGFSYAAVVFSPTLALFLVVSIGLGLVVSRLVYRRVTNRR